MLIAETVYCQSPGSVAMPRVGRTPQGGLIEVNIVEHDGED